MDKSLIDDFFNSFSFNINPLDDYIECEDENTELNRRDSNYPTSEEEEKKNATKLWDEYPDRYEYQIPFADTIVKYDDNGIEYTYDREDIGDGFSSTISIRERISYPNDDRIIKDSLSGKRDELGNIIVTILKKQENKKTLSDDDGKRVLEINE